MAATPHGRAQTPSPQRDHRPRSPPASGRRVAALTPLFERHIIDESIIAQTSPLAPWIALLVLAGVVRFASAYVRRFWAGRVSLDVQNDLRTAVYDNLQRLDFARHDELQTGQLVSRASSDIGLIQGLLAFLPIVLANVLFFAIALVVMVWLSPLLTLVALGRHAAARHHLAEAAAHGVPRQLGRAAAGRRRRRRRRGVGQRRAGRQGLRPGAAPARSGWPASAERLFGSRVRAVRLQARYQPALQAIPSLGPGRGAGARRLAGDPRAHHARHVPRLLVLRHRAAGAGAAC